MDPDRAGKGLTGSIKIMFLSNKGFSCDIQGPCAKI